jgi:hypothetical protein
VRLDDTFAIPPTSIKIRRSQPGPAAHRHQAPTLIGCEFLKNFRLPATRFASLRLQQRSEIMSAASQIVNRFFASAPRFREHFNATRQHRSEALSTGLPAVSICAYQPHISTPSALTV